MAALDEPREAWIIRKAAALIRLGRPLFLTGGVVMVGLGTAMALEAGHPFHLAGWAWCQLAVTATQLMTHYSNDYFDLDADRLNRTPTLWSGGSRVLPGGLLPRRVAIFTAGVLALIALAAGVMATLTASAGLLPVALVVTAMALALAYSAPPFALHSRGVGEITTALIVPGLTPLLAYCVQAGRLDWRPLLVALPLMCLQFAMVLTVEFPDVAGDAQAGKRTLVVRLGGERAARLHNAALLGAYLLIGLGLLLGMPPLVALAMALPVPVAAWQAWRLRRGTWGDPARWQNVAFWGIGLLVATAALGAAAFLALIIL